MDSLAVPIHQRVACVVPALEAHTASATIGHPSRSCLAFVTHWVPINDHVTGPRPDASPLVAAHGFGRARPPASAPDVPNIAIELEFSLGEPMARREHDDRTCALSSGHQRTKAEDRPVRSTIALGVGCRSRPAAPESRR